MNTREAEGSAAGGGVAGMDAVPHGPDSVVSTGARVQQAQHTAAAQAGQLADQCYRNGAPVTTPPAAPNAPAISKPVSVPTNFQAIPAALQALPQWVAWRYVFKDGKWDKVPYQAATNTRASSTNPSTWCSFAEACRFAPYYDGIGFVLVEGNGLVVIDLDDKPEHRASDEDLEFFQEVIANFETYTERSVGGHGVHIVCGGVLPDGIKGRRTGHIEVYAAERYLTFTGNTNLSGLRFLPAPPATVWQVMDCQREIDLLMGVIGKGTETDHTDWNLPQSEPDDKILNRAWHAANGDKFQRLWRGDWQRAYPSQSHADHALLSMLAFYCYNDEQTKRLFRMSALGQRAKAQRDSYLMRSIRPVRAQQERILNQPNPFAKQQAEAEAKEAVKQAKLDALQRCREQAERIGLK